MPPSMGKGSEVQSEAEKWSESSFMPEHRREPRSSCVGSAEGDTGGRWW